MKKTFALALAALIVLSIITMETVRVTDANLILPPESAPSGYTISSNGVCDAPNINQNGNVYTLTGDINGTLVVNCDNIVLDGAGYSFLGQGQSSGIWLQNRHYITIKNLNIDCFANGIRFSQSDWNITSGEYTPGYTTNCSIQGCNITRCNIGISCTAVQSCSFLGNCVANNTQGMSLSGSGNIFRDNKFEANTISFVDYSYVANDVVANDIDTSNSVDGKPIYCWVNKENMTIPNDAGMVELNNCRNISAQGLKLNNDYIGILVYNSSNCRISCNQLSNCSFGIRLRSCFNTTIFDNQFRENDKAIELIHIYDHNENNVIANNLVTDNRNGIDVSYSSNTTVASNQIINNTGYGIQGSSNCSISKNYIFGNGDNGIVIHDISGSTINENNITENSGYGLVFWQGKNGIISSNFISKNKMGISIQMEASENTITLNHISQNLQWGIEICGRSFNNLIYKNNIVDNNNDSQSLQAYVTNIVTRNANKWDSGGEGNYWGNSGENTTTTYYIDELNQDNYPLSKPVAFSSLEIPSVEPSVAPTEPPVVGDINVEYLPVVAIICILVVVLFLVFYLKRNRSKTQSPLN
jgi:parallel beta-helix repeat protein